MKEKIKDPSIFTFDSVLSGGDSTNGLPFFVMPMDQTDLGNHTHDFIELVCVKSGIGKHCHDNQEYPIIAGDCFVIAPGEMHGYTECKQLEIFNILFHQEFLNTLDTEILKMPGFARFFSIEPLFRSETSFHYKLHLAAPDQKKIGSLCAELVSERQNPGPAAKALYRALFAQVAVLLSRCFDNSFAGKKDAADLSGKEKTINLAIAYLEENFATDIHVEDVARCAYLSPGRLAHLFKEDTGTSLIDYLLKVRIDRASTLLRTSTTAITNIAYSTGFHDPSYFSRVFKKATGHSPVAYRTLSK